MKRSIVLTMVFLTSAILQGCTARQGGTTKAETTKAETATAETTTLEVTVRDTTANKGLYKAGSYTADAKGYGGDVVVTVTVDENKITTVSVKGADETEGIGTKAINELPDIILEKQSIEVDAVAGATITSQAIKDALKTALEQAAVK